MSVTCSLWDNVHVWPTQCSQIQRMQAVLRPCSQMRDDMGFLDVALGMRIVFWQDPGWVDREVHYGAIQERVRRRTGTGSLRCATCCPVSQSAGIGASIGWIRLISSVQCRISGTTDSRSGTIKWADEVRLIDVGSYKACNKIRICRVFRWSSTFVDGRNRQIVQFVEEVQSFDFEITQWIVMWDTITRHDRDRKSTSSSVLHEVLTTFFF